MDILYIYVVQKKFNNDKLLDTDNFDQMIVYQVSKDYQYKSMYMKHRVL